MLIQQATASRKLLGIFTIPNPEYYEAIRLDKKLWGKPEQKSVLSGKHMPPGTAYWAHKFGMKIAHPPKKTGGLRFGKKSAPRDYQGPALEKLCQVRHGLLEAPTGSGKTFCATQMTQRLGLKTLCIVNSKEIGQQFIDAYDQFLGYTAGKFFDGKKDIRDVTVTTYNSFILHFDKFVAYGFDLKIVDEADLFITPRCIEAMSSFPAARKYAFTATPRVQKYDDLMKGLPGLMDRLWGYKVKIVTPRQTDILKKIVFRNYDKTYYDHNELPIISKQWHTFREVLDEDQQRKEEQTELIVENTCVSDHSIVLVDRVADAESLYDSCDFKFPGRVYMLHGKMKNRDREAHREGFKRTGGILVANIKIAGRGFDIPAANKAFLCCPVKAESTMRQAVGRIIRWKEGKTATFYDWCDSGLRGQKRTKKKIYAEYFPGANIIEQ